MASLFTLFTKISPKTKYFCYRKSKILLFELLVDFSLDISYSDYVHLFIEKIYNHESKTILRYFLYALFALEIILSIY